MYPIIFLAISGLATLFLGFNENKKTILPISLLFMFVALLSGFIDWNKPGEYFNSMVEVNNVIISIQTVIMLSTIFIMALSSKSFEDTNAHPAEYYSILQLATIGALLMVNFQNLLMLFIGLEILSVALYILTGSDKRNLRGNEATIKYFLMGAFATGILLFGIAMYYGGTGSFNLGSTASLIGKSDEGKIYFWIGFTFISIGLLFKVSAAPFHFWTADVYQGAPTIFTAFMATIVKTAGFFAIYRLFSTSFAAEYAIWYKIIFVAIALSLLIGNLTAVFQSSYKRMLAYSSISQAGFMLFSILGINKLSGSSIGFYSASYALATVTAFGVYMVVSYNQLENGRPNENMNVFNGLYKKSPFLFTVLLVSMLSLSGIPLTSGFWAKFFVFNDAASKGFLWILVFAVVMSAISIYYYFKPLRASFKVASEDSPEIDLPFLSKVALFSATVLTILLGIAPQLLRSVL